MQDSPRITMPLRQGKKKIFSFQAMFNISYKIIKNITFLYIQLLFLFAIRYDNEALPKISELESTNAKLKNHVKGKSIQRLKHISEFN